MKLVEGYVCEKGFSCPGRGVPGGDSEFRLGSYLPLVEVIWEPLRPRQDEQECEVVGVRAGPWAEGFAGHWCPLQMREGGAIGFDCSV